VKRLEPTGESVGGEERCFDAEGRAHPSFAVALEDICEGRTERERARLTEAAKAERWTFTDLFSRTAENWS
jgi:hypothetical protein